jgi:hypothetical protein
MQKVSIEKEIDWFEKNLNAQHVHGNNILTKLENLSYRENKQRKQLFKVIKEYKKWHTLNEKLKGYSGAIIKQRVRWLNKYKDFIENVDFSPQSKFHSSVLEEFLYYLFKDFIEKLNLKIKNTSKTRKLLLGGIRAYTNLYFSPKNIEEFIKNPSIKINEKDLDFAIYKSIPITVEEREETINVPIVAIECKTYIDKTMLEGSIATAEKIKNGNPHCLFIVVTEWYSVDLMVDPAYSRIDQIFVLRKRNHNNPIYPEVVKVFFNFVKKHLEKNWSDIESKLKTEGKIL